MTLSIDGSATSTTLVANAATCSITTSLTNDVIVVYAVSTTTVTQGVVNSISDTAGLTWVKRKAVNGVGTAAAFLNLEEWYAISSGALSSDTITVNWSLAGGARTYVFGVNGANLTTPFDPNVSLPGSANSGTGTSSSLSSTISTSNPNDMLIACLRSNAALGTLTRATGFSALATSPGANQDVSNDIVSSLQSSVAEAFSWTGTASQAILIVDAIQAASTSYNDPLWFGMTA